MATKSYIRKAIEKFVLEHSAFGFVKYSNWYVGVTNNVNGRMSKHIRKNGKGMNISWYWEADSVYVAAALEREFHDLGMQGAGGGWASNSWYIYVYKKAGPWS